jgi:hypothetical protein
MEIELNNQTKLSNAFDNYNNEIEKVNERRKLWSNETKQNIIDILTLINKILKSKFRILKLDLYENYETVNF